MIWLNNPYCSFRIQGLTPKMTKAIPLALLNCDYEMCYQLGGVAGVGPGVPGECHQGSGGQPGGEHESVAPLHRAHSVL